MKILMVGDGSSEIHEVALSKAFKLIGCDVVNFFTSEYFETDNAYLSIPFRIQRKYHLGPLINGINSDLIECVSKGSFDLIFIYRGIDIYPSTIYKIKEISAKSRLVSYNNDNPFSPEYPWWEWRHHLASLSLFDFVFVYRPSDIELARNNGAGAVHLLRSWYIPWLDFAPKNTTDSDIEKYRASVIFVGHYENDGRLQALENLLSNGINIKIFGPYRGLGRSGWFDKIAPDSPLAKITPFEYLRGEEYRKAIWLSDIALCFLSKLNKDTYTRRCFEIPAIGGALFSEYSADLASLYKDGVEAVFFKNKNELLDKVKYYLSHPKELAEIKKNGYLAVKNNGHDIVSRSKRLIESLC